MTGRRWASLAVFLVLSSVGFGGSTTTSTSNSGTAATEATSAASDPTYTAADCASALVALDETPPSGCTNRMTLLGAGCA